MNNLYKNILGRDADTEGLNYWVGNLRNGIETRYEALLEFAELAENKALFSEMTGLTRLHKNYSIHTHQTMETKM